MKRLTGFTGLSLAICLVLYLAGCQGDYDDDSLNIVVFENKTEHAFQIDVWWKKWEKETKFCSLGIPAGASASKDFIYFIFSPGIFSSCSIEFDDGRVLKYPRDIQDPEQKDPSSPLDASAYSKNFHDGVYEWTFVITEDYYLLAE